VSEEKKETAEEEHARRNLETVASLRKQVAEARLKERERAKRAGRV
jgi:hypothetical protein